MARRYIGDAVITIEYDGEQDGRSQYKGTVRAGKHTWKFDNLGSPMGGFRTGSDSAQAYDEMAQSAVSFGSYYSSGNRGDDTPEWAPSEEIADAINDAVGFAQRDDGTYEVKRSPSGKAHEEPGARELAEPHALEASRSRPKVGKTFKFGHVQVEVAYYKDRDLYRGDLMWPEISDDGRISPAIKHHKIETIPAARLLTRFTDVRNPGSNEKLEAAALEMVKASGLPHFLWKHEGGARETTAREQPYPTAREAARPKRLDEFTRAYIEAMLFSTSDQSDEQGGEPLDKNYSVSDIAPETMELIVEDCADFQKRFGHLIEDDGGDWGRAGHDFWLTREGHGAGFWDGGWPNHGDELSEAAKSYGGFDLTVGDDGLIYGPNPDYYRNPPEWLAKRHPSLARPREAHEDSDRMLAHRGKPAHDGTISWVSHLPGVGGVDWGYTKDSRKAVPLTKHQQQRFARYMDSVGDSAVFVPIASGLRETREAARQVVRDFNTLEELVKHEQAAGATHVWNDSREVFIFYPVAGGKYQEGKVWQQGGYWHATAPSQRHVDKLPGRAEPIEKFLARLPASHRAREVHESRRVELPRPVVQVTIRSEQGQVLHSETKSAFNSGIRASEDAIRNIARAEGTTYEAERPTRVGDVYTRRWTSRAGKVVIATIEKMPEGHTAREVRDYQAVDPRGKFIGGPSKDYEKAKREADQGGGYVRFVMPRANEAAGAAGTKIMVMTRDLTIGDGPGPVRTHLKAGDRVEVGGEAGNRAYLIAFRVQQHGKGWRKLGPFAVIPKDALAPEGGRSRATHAPRKAPAARRRRASKR